MTIRLALVDLPDELRNVCYFGHLLYASTYFPIDHYAQCDSMSQIAPLVPPIATLHRKLEPVHTGRPPHGPSLR